MKTIIVRRPRAASRAFDGPVGMELAPDGERVAAAVAAETSVSVDDLSVDDRADLDASHEFLTADPMPLQLIEPVGGQGDGPPPPPPPSDDAKYADFIEDDGHGGKAAWGIVATGAAASAFTGAGVPVAVLDTGIDHEHPAFAGVNLVRRNFTTAPDADVNGHGTHCAGTIFGRDVDGIRIGVARGVTQAFIAKVLPGDSGDLVDALKWAFDSGARVASMSLGFDFQTVARRLRDERGLPEPAAINTALTNFRANIAMFDALMGLFRAQALQQPGMVIVAATGNASERKGAPPYTIDIGSPAAAFGVVGIGALARSSAGLVVADFSNTTPRICAPGVEVLSARKGAKDLVTKDGTSMACPHVAGLAALYWDQALHVGGQAKAEAVAGRLAASAFANSAKLAPGSRAIDVGEGLPSAP